MRTIHVLAPGPSLKHYSPPWSPDVTVCINSAIFQYSCDWWAFQDHPLWEQTDKRPRVGLITVPATVRKLTSCSEYEIKELGPKADADRNRTAPRTVSAVLRDWPDYEIHLYGFDMLGEQYYDDSVWMPHRRATSKRPPEQWAAKAEDRWDEERKMLARFLKCSNVFLHKVD